MKLTNIPANLLSLGAIDFGIIADGAIVMMETILKKREDNEEEELTEKSIAERVKSEIGIVIATNNAPLQLPRKTRGP